MSPTSAKRIVTTDYLTIDKFTLHCGETLDKLRVAYEQYGDYNKDKVILVIHPLTMGPHAAFYSSEQDQKPGWWDIYIGPGKAIDTDHYYVLCPNSLGGCYGSTGGLEWQEPKDLHMEDWVEFNRAFLREINIQKVYALVGGSTGGMQALEWAITHPGEAHKIILIAAAAAMPSVALAYNYLQQVILEEMPERRGLAVARMLGHINYLNEEILLTKFQGEIDTIGSYLEHKGSTFIQRFSPNTYRMFQNVLNSFNLIKKYGSLAHALSNVEALFYLMSFSSDTRFPPRCSHEIASALQRTGKLRDAILLNTPFGHDSFLVPGAQELIEPVLRSWINDSDIQKY